MSFIKNHKGIVIAIAIAVVLAIIAIIGFSSYGNVRKGVISRENSLVAQYKDNQNELSNYILSFNESLGIADRQSDKLNDILLDAVKGRYDNDTSLEPGTGGAMFSAITEAYPDLTATTESYAKVQDLIVSGRSAYKNKQSKLLDLIRDYNTWTEEDLFRSMALDIFFGGAPTDNLRVTDAGKTYEGQAALDQISQIVLVQGAVDAYDKGIQEPLLVPSE